MVFLNIGNSEIKNAIIVIVTIGVVTMLKDSLSNDVLTHIRQAVKQYIMKFTMYFEFMFNFY